jgi:hypothetical protein
METLSFTMLLGKKLLKVFLNLRVPYHLKLTSLKLQRIIFYKKNWTLNPKTQVFLGSKSFPSPKTSLDLR